MAYDDMFYEEIYDKDDDAEVHPVPKKLILKDLRELERAVLSDIKHTEIKGKETLEIINKLRDNFSLREARKLLNRMNWLGYCQDTASYVYHTIRDHKIY